MPAPRLDHAATFRLLYHVCVDLYTLGRLSEAGLRHHLDGLGYTPRQIDAEIEGLQYHRRAA